VAVSWEKVFGKLVLHIDGKEVWSTATHDAKPANGKVAFSKAEFIGSGCLMLGQKAKRPCAERMAWTSYLGELTDFQLLSGALTTSQIKEQMIKPVDPGYLATMTETNVINKPDPNFMRAAFLSRQYGSQEMNVRYPPVCALKKEERLTIMGALPGQPNWAQLCEQVGVAQHPTAGRKVNSGDCFMSWSGQGDVHYRNFGGCHYDDQLIGPFVAVQMKPQFHKLHPLTIQWMNRPVQNGGFGGNDGGCSWCQPVQTKTIKGQQYKLPAMLSYVDGCAIKFDNERISAAFGHGHYNIQNTRTGATTNIGGYTRFGEFEKDGVIKKIGPSVGHTTNFRQSCNGVSNCYESKHFSGSVSTGRLSISMPADGTSIYCQHVSAGITVPRKIEGKIMGMAGCRHKQTFYGPNGNSRSSVRNVDDWTVGTNKAIVDHINKKNAGGCFSRCSGYGWNNNDKIPLVVGEQVPALNKASQTCATGYVYGQRSSPFNGNAPWKGLAKMITSWTVDDLEIPSVFGKDKFPEMWKYITPSDGESATGDGAARKLAEKGCESLKPLPNKYSGCIFDFMLLGGRASEDNLKMAGEVQQVDSTKPTLRSVRDSSGGNNHGEWVGHPSWGCVDEFSLHITDVAKKHMSSSMVTNKKNEMCQCKHTYLGGCAYDHFICLLDLTQINEDINKLATIKDDKPKSYPTPKPTPAPTLGTGKTVARGSQYGAVTQQTDVEKKAYCRCVTADNSKGISICNTGCGNPNKICDTTFGCTGGCNAQKCTCKPHDVATNDMTFAQCKEQCARVNMQIPMGQAGISGSTGTGCNINGYIMWVLG